ncbi:MAG: hypothetical protein NVSMB3_11200 [Acidobacteriaceae bacterium]
MHSLRLAGLVLGVLFSSSCLRPASALQEVPEPAPLSPGLSRIAGEDPASRIQYVRLLLRGRLTAIPAPSTQTSAPPATPAFPPPTLTAQCSLQPEGKYTFDIFADLGAITDRAFYPPWKPASPHDLFPPRTQKLSITLDFLGYTHVKPVRRQWEIPVPTPAQFRSNPPGSGSTNMEDVSFYLRYLLALPTLRLTLPGGQSAEFLATPLLDQIRREPLCRAAHF